MLSNEAEIEQYLSQLSPKKPPHCCQHMEAKLCMSKDSKTMENLSRWYTYIMNTTLHSSFSPLVVPPCIDMPRTKSRLPSHPASGPPSRGSSGSRAITPHISRAQTPETRASSHEEDNARPLIPVQFSPIKQRQKAKAANQVADKHDLDIWDLPDDEIIEASFAHLKSLAYQYFNITLDCVLKDDEPSELVFIFTCKTDPDRHTAHRWGRMKTHAGTGNLQKGIKACNQLNGLAEDGSSLVPHQSDSDYIPYSESAHRAIISLQCAVNQCPFNSVKDGLYRLEVAMLRKGTVLPSPEQVGRDTRLLYREVSGILITSGIHLVLDGWTAPIIASYLGLVIIWSEQGTIYRTVLEFIRLKHKHTGEYLAKVVFDCLKRWGLTKKMFMSFFFKKGKKKSNQAIVSDDGLVSVDDHSIFVADQVVEDEDDEDDGVLEEDDGHAIFNQEAVLALHQPAIMQMQAREEPVTATPAQLRTAESIMPRVSGLARRIHDSPTLREQFDELVSKNPRLDGAKRSLNRWVATCWNSDFLCLNAHVYFRKEVEIMTGISDNNLTQYPLSADQWKIVTDLLPVLEIFKEATDLFSKAEVPLIVDAFPLLLDIRTYLVNVCEDDDDELSPVIRIAAQAAISMLNKYITLCEECEIYFITIVMCPDRKLQWFKDNGFSCAVISQLKQTVIDRWEQNYRPDLTPDSGSDSARVTNKYMKRPTAAKSTAGKLDDIHTYLKEPVIQSSTVIDSGGYMKWWNTTATSRPNLARMGMNYCSAPGSYISHTQSFLI
ncbi:hypothetical protein D9756_006943 [Leucocoprinus leucothites]|uniref:Uncharacterized protein n=1 Tax=Leucocoprinus leucothites TaxID=201217 RepID=A0A8H5D789_9AGAR|nr:hypothetical protein D9756_006943 [Leucoagaricus leucothites]